MTPYNRIFQSYQPSNEYFFIDVDHPAELLPCYVIVELADYFDIDFPADAVANMRAKVEALDSLNKAETRNSKVPHEMVKEVQTLLHVIGFKCWNIDGVAGKRTVKAIKRFQEMYGFEIDGIIDDELVEQLKQVCEEKGINISQESEKESGS